jgi:hypothetical protein
MLFDLSQLAIPENAEVQLKHPATNELLFADKDKTQIVGIELASKSSAEYREAIDALQKRYLARKGKPSTPEENKQESLDLLLAISIRGINFTYAGKELATSEDFEALYQDPKFYWVKDQVDEALGDVSSFLKQ